MSIRLNENETLRQALSRLRKEMKSDGRFDVVDDIKDVVLALSSDDAKTRKNAALLLGDLKANGFGGREVKEIESVFDSLVMAYKNETTLFVRPSILEGLKEFISSNEDLSRIKDILSEKLHDIDDNEHEDSEMKHLREERHLISLILSIGDKCNHEVTNLIKPFEVLLTCDKGFADNIAKEIVGEAKVTPIGVRSRISRLNDLKKIRLYRELLFLVPIKRDYICTADSLGELPQKTAIIKLLEDLFEAKGDSFRFRIEISSSDENVLMGKFIKKVSAEMEKSSNQRLINDPSDYEVIIVLKERKDGRYSSFVKIPKLSEERFSYRQFSEPTSMAGVTAAEVVSEIKEYIKKDSWIIDPFCGTGTLLLERALYMPSREYYGIDTYGQAIKEARINAENAGVEVHFINRNFFDFISDYPFHEILGEFPDFYGKEPSEREDFYKNFFKCAIEIAANGAMMFLISADENMIKKYIRLNSELKFVRSKDLTRDLKIYIIGVEK